MSSIHIISIYIAILKMLKRDYPNCIEVCPSLRGPPVERRSELPSSLRENEPSNEISALAARQATLFCGLNSSGLSSDWNEATVEQTRRT